MFRPVWGSSENEFDEVFQSEVSWPFRLFDQDVKGDCIDFYRRDFRGVGLEESILFEPVDYMLCVDLIGFHDCDFIVNNLLQCGILLACRVVKDKLGKHAWSEGNLGLVNLLAHRVFVKPFGVHLDGRVIRAHRVENRHVGSEDQFLSGTTSFVWNGEAADFGP